MSKYIIDIPDNVKKIVCFHLGNANAVWTTSNDLDDLEQLNSDYINEHFSDLQDDAYNKGYAQCQDDYGDALKHAKDTAYKKGLEDGKAVNDKGCEGCMYQDNTIEHHPCGVCRNAYNNRWKAKDDKIEVGDEVEPFYTDITGVVTLIDGDTIYVLWRDGLSTSTLKLKEVTKTGRHFDIASILEDMRND